MALVWLLDALFVQQKLIVSTYIERVNPVGVGRSLRIPLRIATLFGAFGGFLYAYQNSSCKENDNVYIIYSIRLMCGSNSAFLGMV